MQRRSRDDGKPGLAAASGSVEEDRTPNFRRCERIRWPKPVIEHDGDPAVKVWRNQRGREERVCLRLEQELSGDSGGLRRVYSALDRILGRAATQTAQAIERV